MERRGGGKRRGEEEKSGEKGEKRGEGGEGREERGEEGKKEKTIEFVLINIPSE